MRRLGNRKVGGDDKKQGTRYYTKNKRKGAFRRENDKRRRQPPRVILLDLNRLLITHTHTNTRILTQEVLHRLLFVYTWCPAQVWEGLPASRPFTSKATAGHGSGHMTATHAARA